MFNIDDNFLASVGYDTGLLSEEEKSRIKQQFIEDLNKSFTQRIMQELDIVQQDEFNDIQENAKRAFRWLREFHADYESRQNYRELLDNGYTEDDAVTFYASILWMGDAVPGFGVIAQEVLDGYRNSLIGKRREVNQALGL